MNCAPNQRPKPFSIARNVIAELLFHLPHRWNGVFEGIFPRLKGLRIRAYGSHDQLGTRS